MSTMRLIFKITCIFIVIAVAFFLIYAVCGQEVEVLFRREKCIEWFSGIKPFAWIVAVLLLTIDILIPIPATGIMAALGAVYGPVTGAVISATGSVCAGLAGYAVARLLGEKGTAWLAGPGEMERFSAFFNIYGAYAVILSRMVPVMPEVISILAGMANMKFARFAGALLIGTFPVALVFSWMGSLSGTIPGAGIAGAAILPVIAWPFVIRWFKL